jgi:hypothetical protein
MISHILYDYNNVKINKAYSITNIKILVYSYNENESEINSNSTFISAFVNSNGNEELKILNKKNLDKLRKNISNNEKRTWSSNLPWRLGSDVFDARQKEK